ncbi:MAG TPA: DnaB-like helicase C-terminal domain-containing protein [Candidatus Kapabacteria bacterium]|nr:DnaB-like helicase C-terminal domain-containing protein [Candidatus Kapabacteria bacterium]
MDEDFLDELLKCSISDKTFLQVCLDHLKINYLPDERYRNIWKTIIKFYTAEGVPPTIGKLKMELRRDLDCNVVLSKIRDTVIVNQESILKQLEQFIRQNRFVQFYNDVGDLYNKDEKSKAFNMFVKEAEKFNKFSLQCEMDSRVFKDFSKRQTNRLTKDNKRYKIPYSIDYLNTLTENGSETGELTLYLGDSGVGKSTLLISDGIAAARRGFKVAHFQIEGTKEQCEDRYDSAWTGMLYKDIKSASIETEQLKKFKKIASMIGRGDIFIIAYEQFGSKTIVDIRSKLIELNKIHGKIDRVVLDYLELIEPGNGIKYTPDQERHRQTQIMRGLKQLAMEFNCDVITATQSNSIRPEELNNPDFVLTRYNLSEDKGKIRAADNFITINQTNDEKKERVARLYVDKFRQYPCGQTFSIAQALERARFYDKKRTLQEFLTDED